MRLAADDPEAITRGYVTTAERQIHYRRSGSTGPPLLLLHEAPLSSGIFVPALPALGAATRVWALDLPGYGMSDAPSEPPAIEDYATDVVSAAAELGLDTFALCGVHTGALLAIEIASIIAPDRVSHLVLGGVPLFTEDQRAGYSGTWPDKQMDDSGEHLQWAWRRYTKSWGEDTPVDLLTYASLETAGNLPGYNWASRASYAYDAESRLPGISVPTLVLNAEHGLFAHLDPVVLDLLGHGSHSIIPGISGQMPWRSPGEFARLILDFVT